MKTGLLVVISALLIGCNATRIIQPLDEGVTQISVSAGGPIIGSPLPLSSIGVAHGFSDKLTFFGGMQMTDLLFNTLQFDLGASFGLREPLAWKPGISAYVALNPITETRAWSFNLFPETAINAYWLFKDKHLPYFGGTIWYDPAYGNNALGNGKIIHPTIYLGYNYQGARWTYGIEGKWLNLNKTLAIPQVQHTSIGGKGGVGVYLKVGFNL